MGITIGVAAVLLVMGIMVLCGKGDSLIAGFNTASAEEKEKEDMGRLRLLVGALCLIIAVLIVPFNILVRRSSDPATIQWIFRGAVVFLAGAVIVLANTWCKKKQ